MSHTVFFFGKDEGCGEMGKWNKDVGMTTRVLHSQILNITGTY